MSKSGFTWDMSPQEAFVPMYDYYERRTRALIRRVLQFWRPQIVAWMKTNAAWTDQTGQARKRLHAEIEEMVNELAIVLDHGMDYGVFLELKNAGKFAIIGPAVDHFAPLAMQSIQAAMDQPELFK